MTRFHLFFAALSLSVLVWGDQSGADTRQLAEKPGETVQAALGGAVVDARRTDGEPQGTAPMCHDCTLPFAAVSGVLAGIALPCVSAQSVRWVALAAAETQHGGSASLARGPPPASCAFPTL